MSRRNGKNQDQRPKTAPSDPAFAEPRKNLPADARALIANAMNDITIPYYSGVLSHADDTLVQQGGGKGVGIYDEIERDTHAFAMLQKRKKALIAREWEVRPGGDRPIDKDAADLVQTMIRGLPFDRICEDLLDATLKGFAVSEIVWERDATMIRPVRIVSHNQRRFVFDHDWRPRLKTLSAMLEGIALPERKFIVHRHAVKGNNPYGLGLGTRLFWPVLFKREGITFWLHFLEKFAAPAVVGTTPYGMLSEEQTKLLNTLGSVKTASAITVPVGTDVKFLEASRSGTVTYQEFVEYWDRQISICVTGETLTTQAGDAGSRALGEVHAEMLELLVDSDADLLSATLRETLIRWIVDYNLPGAAVPELWRVRARREAEEAETRTKQASAASAIVKAVAEIVDAAAQFDDDGEARAFIVSFDVMDQFSDSTIDGLVASRSGFSGTRPAGDPLTPPAAFAGRLKKKA